MLGSIIGDVAGSYIEVLEINALKNNDDKKRSYEERIKILDRNIKLFNTNSSYTDDSVLTTAIADSLLNDKNYEFYLRKYGNYEINLGKDKYGRSRFGSGFVKWLYGMGDGKSFGNGASMRISPVAYYFDDINEMHENVCLATIPSHNNIDAINHALMVADSIYLSRFGYNKDYIKKYLLKNYNVNLNFNLNDLQKNYRFSSKSSESVPQAIFCFLNSNSFEDTIRKSLSIGGDADTIACIAGSIAEAYYGLDDKLASEVISYIPDYMLKVVNKFYDTIDKKDNKGVKKYGKQFKKDNRKIN